MGRGQRTRLQLAIRAAKSREKLPRIAILDRQLLYREQRTMAQSVREISPAI